MTKEKKTLICKRYNSAGDCIEFEVVEGHLKGFITAEAKACAPKLVKEAEKMIKEGKLYVQL